MDPLTWPYEPENFVLPPSEELVCRVCYIVLRDPVLSPCKHQFCRSCIYRWLEKNQTCPLCRRYLFEVTALDELKALIMSLKIRCPRTQSGCVSKFTLQNYHHHLQVCEYEVTEEELKVVHPDENYVTRLLQASRWKSCHHLIPEILRTEKETINMRTKDARERTALLVALEHGCSLETLNDLLNAGAPVTVKDKFEENPLHSALTGKCDLQVIRKLLQLNKEKLYQSDMDGIMPFTRGLASGCSLEVFCELVEAGAHFTHWSCSLNITHLHYASMGGCCKEILEEIIRRKPDWISHQNYLKQIPLHCARDEWVVRTLIEAGSDTDAKDFQGNTPLQHALAPLWPLQQDITYSTIELYLEHMSAEQVQQVNKEDETLLHSACKRAIKAKLVRRLMKLGLDPAKKNKQGETALHVLPLRFKAVPIVKELLKGHPYLVEIVNGEGSLVKCFEFAREMVKWVSLQNESIAERMIRTIEYVSFINKTILFLEKCQLDLKLLQDHRISESSSLRDLLLKDYLTENISVSFWRECALALDFDASRLSVFGEEVLELQRKVREE